MDVRPPYQRRQWEGEVTGPITKKTASFFDFERRDIDDNAFVNATILDSSFNPVPFTQAIVTPTIGIELNGRIDTQLSQNHTLALRYGYAHDERQNQGVGGFSLLSRAYQVLGGDQTFQAVETGVLNLHTINETRFRFRHQNTDQSGGQSVRPSAFLTHFPRVGLQ